MGLSSIWEWCFQRLNVHISNCICKVTAGFTRVSEGRTRGLWYLWWLGGGLACVLTPFKNRLQSSKWARSPKKGESGGLARALIRKKEQSGGRSNPQDYTVVALSLLSDTRVRWGRQRLLADCSVNMVSAVMERPREGQDFEGEGK